MKPHQIKVTFEAYAADYPNDPTGLLHRIRNLGEDIWREIRGKRIAKILNMDSATDSLDLTVPSAGKLRRVVKLIEASLAEHNFEAAKIHVTESQKSE